MSASKWKQARCTWNKRGMREVVLTDPQFDLLENVKEGINHMLENCPELGSKDELTAADYTHVYTYQSLNTKQEKVTFMSYASAVFASIRHAIMTNDEIYSRSMCTSSPYLTFKSNSKSGELFFLSNDKRFFMKTEKPFYVKFFLKMLRDYLNHFISYPHSLIVKYVGVFSVSVPNKYTKYILVMQNIFFPSERVEVCYDLKGCVMGRYERPQKDGDTVTNVLKDANFGNKYIELGPQAGWLRTQVKQDLDFLRRRGVVDYSLLIGQQSLQDDEKMGNLPNLVQRLYKLVYGIVSETSKRV